MRICFINLDYIRLRTSGLAVYGETLVAGLAARGHELTVVTRYHRGSPRRERLGDVDVHRVGPGHGDWIGLACAGGPYVGRLHAVAPFDIIHFADLHFAARFRGPFVASLLQSFRQRLTSDGGRPYHNNAVDLVSKRVYYEAARRLAETPSLFRAQHLVAVSQATAVEFIQRYRVPPQQVTTIPIGIDLTRLREADPEPLRRKLGLTHERVLLFVGFCAPRKGLEYLARAMRELPDDVRLIVVGRWQQAYRTMVLEAFGSRRAHLIEIGYVPDEELPQYYSLADVFVFPSLLEGFGIPIVEALASGTPVVTTDAGACAETAGPGAYIVPPRDANALAEAIGRLLASPAERQRLGAAGRIWAHARYSQEAMVSAYEEIYQRFARSSGPQSGGA